MLSTTFLTALLASKLASAASCFMPNGTSINEPSLQPCSFDSSNPLSSTCCHTNWDNAPGGNVDEGGPTKDLCLPNGLCQNRGKSNDFPEWTHYYRVYCTNETWKGCLSVCDTGDNAKSLIQLTPCDGTATSDKWCCGDTTQCCTPQYAHQAVIIPRDLGVQTTSSTPSSLAPTSSPSAASPATPGSTDARDIGLGVGLGLGLPVLILGAVWLYLHYRKKKQAQEPGQLPAEEKGEGDKGPKTMFMELASPVSEMPSVRHEPELMGDIPPPREARTEAV